MSELRWWITHLRCAQISHDIRRLVVRAGTRSRFCMMLTCTEVWYEQWWWWWWWWYHLKCGVFHALQKAKKRAGVLWKHNRETLGNLSCWKATGNSFFPLRQWKGFRLCFLENVINSSKWPIIQVLRHGNKQIILLLISQLMKIWSELRRYEEYYVIFFWLLGMFLACQALPLQILLFTRAVNAALNGFTVFQPGKVFLYDVNHGVLETN